MKQPTLKDHLPHGAYIMRPPTQMTKMSADLLDISVEEYSGIEENDISGVNINVNTNFSNNLRPRLASTDEPPYQQS